MNQRLCQPADRSAPASASGQIGKLNNTTPLAVGLVMSQAERVGFEPTILIQDTRFRDARTRPTMRPLQSDGDYNTGVGEAQKRDLAPKNSAHLRTHTVAAGTRGPVHAIQAIYRTHP